MRLPTLLVLLAVHAIVVLGGMFLMLQAFGEELDSELDRQVQRIERDLERDFGRVRRDVRRELDQRLPPPVTAP